MDVIRAAIPELEIVPPVGSRANETGVPMAHKDVGYFDNRGHFFKTPEEATVSDLSRLLGRIGEGDSLAPGIAILLLERRRDIERIFAEHDELKTEQTHSGEKSFKQTDNVTPLPNKLVGTAG